MAKSAFDKIKAGLDDALAIARGEADPDTYRVYIPSELDVRGIRKKLKLTQREFASRYGFNVGRVRDWEQGRSRPDSAARAYLLVIFRNPTAVEDALSAEVAHRMGEPARMRA